MVANVHMQQSLVLFAELAALGPGANSGTRTEAGN
jgi:hypothetical protein